jgi:uncharacterized membrane protein
MDQPLPADAPETPPPVARTSLVSRLFNMFAAPTEVFDEVKASPASSANWVVPALLFTVIGWLCGWLIISQDFTKQQISDMQDKAIQKQVEKGKLTKEQAEASRAVVEKFGSLGTMIGVAAAPPIMGFAGPLWFGLIVWLFGAKLFKGGFTFMKGVEVAGLVAMIAVLESVLHTLMVFVLGNMFAGPNLGLLVIKDYDPNNWQHSLLSKVDLVTFWELAVLSLGLARLGGVRFGRALAWLGGLWLAWTVFLTALIMGIQKLTGN